MLAGLGLGALGMPSSYLFAALLVGIAVALTRPGTVDVAPQAFTAAQAVTGVAIGGYLQSSSLSALGDAWLPVALVSAATLVVSLAAGAALARTTSLDEPTAALGMVAGGASGIVGMAGELGADDRLVAFMQYLRVLVVVLVTPLLVAFAFGGGGGGGGVPDDGPVLGDLDGWGFTVAGAVVGTVVATRVRLTAASLMGPLILSGAVHLSTGSAPDVPPLLRETAFALIGLQVGLRFTVAALRQAGRLLVPTLVAIVVLLAACALLAVGLDAATSVSLLDAYLATTPGGLYAVLAAAFGSGADTTFVVAVQGLRLLVMILLAPVAVRLVVGHGARRGRHG